MKANRGFGTVASRTIAALALGSGLQPRRMGFGHLAPGADYAAVLLSGGFATVVSAETRFDLTAPAAVWLRLSPDTVLIQQPGSPGYVLGVSEPALIEATADGADAALLRSFAGKSFLIESTPPVETRELTVALEAVLRETRAAGQGSRTLRAAYMRIILVSLWRLSGVDAVGEAAFGQARAVLIRFRELVEIHFRDHWRIQDYARTLGVSHDRLHAICTRDLGRTPLALLHDRLNFEALRHLDRAALGVHQISHALGFRDPAHFSTFFKRLNGMSPAAYRAEARRRDTRMSASQPASYADWP